MTSPVDVAAQQQAAQIGLVGLLTDNLTQLWPALDLKRLPQSLTQLKAAVAALVQQYGMASASLAADFYDTQRAAADVTGRFTVTPSEPASVQQVDQVIGWATKGLWSQTPDVSAAQTLVTGAVDKMVIDTGRQTIVDAVHRDTEARGWARVTRPGACSFCRLLATRGAVYKTKASGGFQAHDHDHCFVEPLFGGSYEMAAHVRADEALYKRVTKGKSGKAARLAFRQAVEAQSSAPD